MRRPDRRWPSGRRTGVRSSTTTRARRNHSGVDSHPSSQPMGAGARYGTNHDRTSALCVDQAAGSASSIAADRDADERDVGRDQPAEATLDDGPATRFAQALRQDRSGDVEDRGHRGERPRDPPEAQRVPEHHPDDRDGADDVEEAVTTLVDRRVRWGGVGARRRPVSSFRGQRAGRSPPGFRRERDR